MVIVRGRAAIAIAAGLITLAAGCNRGPTPAELQAKFDEAERLCLDQQYADAQSALKAYLMLDPLHPGAHFYLARTYLASLDVRQMGLAENEFKTALGLFERRNRESGIKRYDARYFELMCNIDAAKALLIQAEVFARERSLVDVSLQSLARAEQYIAAARTVNPNATEITDTEKAIQDFAAQLTRRR